MRRVLSRGKFEDSLDLVGNVNGSPHLRELAREKLLEHDRVIRLYYREMQQAIVKRDEKARARRTDPETSHSAARSLDPEKLGNVREKLYWLLVHGGPRSDEAIEKQWKANVERYGWPEQSPQSLRSRRSELCKMESPLIEDSKKTTKNRNGNNVIVWMAVPKLTHRR